MVPIYLQKHSCPDFWLVESQYRIQSPKDVCRWNSVVQQVLRGRCFSPDALSHQQVQMRQKDAKGGLQPTRDGLPLIAMASNLLDMTGHPNES